MRNEQNPLGSRRAGTARGLAPKMGEHPKMLTLWGLMIGGVRILARLLPDGTAAL